MGFRADEMEVWKFLERGVWGAEAGARRTLGYKCHARQGVQGTGAGSSESWGVLVGVGLTAQARSAVGPLMG